MQVRWRWPPDRVTPRSPISVRSPSGKRATSSVMAAWSISSATCASLSSPSAPKRMLSAYGTENRNASWGT